MSVGFVGGIVLTCMCSFYSFGLDFTLVWTERPWLSFVGLSYDSGGKSS